MTVHSWSATYGWQPLAIGGKMNWIYTWYSPNERLTPGEIADSMAIYALRVGQADSDDSASRRTRSSKRA